MTTATRICSTCKGTGHNARTCPYKGKQIRRCGECDSLGHNSRTCPKKRKSKQKQAAKVATSSKKAKTSKSSVCAHCGQKVPTVSKTETSGRVCSLCSKAGHNSRTCPTYEYVEEKEVSKKTSSKKTSKVASGGRTCGSCGKVGTGHNSRTCPKAKK